MANTKHEDAVLKMGFEYFRDTILKILGIDYEFVDIGPTELVELTIHSLYMDFTFLTTDGIYIHIEFQTTDSGEKDLRRFHAYDAVYSHKKEKKVITYVIYSGGITHVRTELDCGLYTYRISPVYMKEKNADEVFRKLRTKKENGEAFTDEDYAALSLTPLMAGEMERKERFKEALILARQEKEISAEKSMAILYTLADKFLDGADIDELKEVLRMTRLGQLLHEEGYTEGRVEGRVEGRTEEVVRSVQNLMKNLNLTIGQAMDILEIPEDSREKYRKLLEEDIRRL